MWDILYSFFPHPHWGRLGGKGRHALLHRAEEEPTGACKWRDIRGPTFLGVTFFSLCSKASLTAIDRVPRSIAVSETRFFKKTRDFAHLPSKMLSRGHDVPSPTALTSRGIS